MPLERSLLQLDVSPSLLSACLLSSILVGRHNPLLSDFFPPSSLSHFSSPFTPPVYLIRPYFSDRLCAASSLPFVRRVAEHTQGGCHCEDPTVTTFGRSGLAGLALPAECVYL